MNEKAYAALTRVKNTASATAHLNLGWELVDTHTRLLGDPGQVGDEYMVFILGWPRGLGPEKYPDDPDKDGVDD